MKKAFEPCPPTMTRHHPLTTCEVLLVTWSKQRLIGNGSGMAHVPCGPALRLAMKTKRVCKAGPLVASTLS